MAKHTKGPWWHREIENGPGWSIREPDGHKIGEAYSKADALMFRAAPDLLTALRAVISVADRKTAEFDLARAAIARATGESK